jgi:hypothetical protein
MLFFVLGETSEEREEAGSLAALGMTTRKAKAKTRAKAAALHQLFSLLPSPLPLISLPK